jgi:hypothetical protein
MYVFVNECPPMDYDLEMTVLDHLGLFWDLEEALAALVQTRRDCNNPNICVYELVRTPEEQDAEDGWDKEDEEGCETPPGSPKILDLHDSVETMAANDLSNKLKNM